jgi:transaldolase/glucose-6-phosphate isomerase
MTDNPLSELQRHGQSVWYDNIRRGLITSGELAKLIADGVTGVTSNPTIFEKAISGSRDYDEHLRRLVAEGKEVGEIFESLAVEDIRAAADLLRPIYDRSDGRDGFVSMEVSPTLAHDARGTIEEAHRLVRAIDRHNLMIKVPATVAGLAAIEQLIGDGVNVNVTLLFSVERYEAVAAAYLSGLERRIREGEPVDRIASVASFFVSRVDSLVDKLLQAKLREAATEDEAKRAQALMGRAAIANAKIAYAKFKAIFGGPRWVALAANGTRVQRLLWASTGTKNPAHSDVYYVEALVGPDTVNTLPPATLTAFRDHGRVRATLEEDLQKTEAILRELAAVGIDLDQVTRRLEEQGVKAFADSFEDLFRCIAAKRDLLTSGLLERQAAVLHEHAGQVEPTLSDLETREAAARIWAKDPTLWKSAAEHQKIIRESLGWLGVAEMMRENTDELREFAREVREAGFRDLLLLGMGGSSLCPDVLRLTFGSERGFPRLHVLDTTDPASIRAVEKAIDLPHTLVIVASKSGTTPEIIALHQYFFAKLTAMKDDHAGNQFVAITDPGTPLEAAARAQSFRRIFLNPSDIGGRYSALSYFGLVPAALLGLDVPTLLDRAERMAHACVSCVPTRESPGLWLGAVMGSLALRGREKVTFVCSPEIAAFGSWVEQLIAESTGKEGKGILPVEGEDVAAPSRYGNDRLFVYLRLEGTRGSGLDAKVARLERSHPVVTIRLQDLYDLGGEFFRWEFATAVAGAVIGVNPFDQPNVQESKDNTKQLLEEYKVAGALPEDEPISSDAGVELYGDAATASVLKGSESLAAALKAHLSRFQKGDYVALTAYLQRTVTTEKALAAIRKRARDRFTVATTLGYGPRFLHSTGQLHKGGAGNGVFLQFTADDRQDLPIPGEPYSFGIMKRAQALGDLRALQRRGRRVLRIHFTADVSDGLSRVRRAITAIR